MPFLPATCCHLLAPLRTTLPPILQDAMDFHEEVFGAAIYSFAHAGAQLSTYHPPYRAGFSLVTGPLFDGRSPTPLEPPANLIHDLKHGALDLAVITSADAGWLDQDVVDALVKAEKTQAVLFFHQMKDFGSRAQREALAPLARERRLTVVGLGEVVYVLFLLSLSGVVAQPD